ncbi:hypothetical protein B5I05_22940 [Shigella dysenteriae]|nr:hypothetical protein [Shigella flexneri]EFX6401796.1 hypothetical protein [Shigella boydii]EFY9877131.1 hypothetical protein [Shigella dysenteriae]EIQ36243.1 hypothetical protein SB96558_5543 [Shigella boydii 965-58]EFY9795979.1 hypothetical protein [Shigella flexneri]
MLLWFEKYIFLFGFIQKRVVGDYWMTRQRVVGDLSMTQHTVALVFREGESPESREEKYWMTRRRLP